MTGTILLAFVCFALGIFLGFSLCAMCALIAKETPKNDRDKRSVDTDDLSDM